MAQEYEWDEDKARTNRRKHGVGFEEAKTVFNDPLALTIPDPDHSGDEQRFIDLGESEKSKLLVVVYTQRGNKIRIISCRNANRAERRMYEEGQS